MAPLDEFIKRVRELRRQGCTEEQIVTDVRVKYPQICQTADDALKKIQEIDRKNFNPKDW